MGNKPISIGLTVSTKGPHVAGSIIYGRVYLSISKQPLQAQSLRLKVVGKENLVVHHTSTEDSNGGNRSRQQHHHQQQTQQQQRDYYEHATHTILEMDYPLCMFKDGVVPVGQYEYPFALQLPEDLPSTMNCRR
jgi:hypothetical protein